MVAPIALVRNEAFKPRRERRELEVRDLAEIVRETFAGCEIEYAKKGALIHGPTASTSEAGRDAAGCQADADGSRRHLESC